METTTVDYLKKIDELQKRVQVLEAENRRLGMLSSKDPLTGISNRRRIDEVLAQLYRALHEKNCNSISALLIDLDNFKRINDVHGHSVGDEVLCKVATFLKMSTRGDGEVGHGRSIVTARNARNREYSPKRRIEAGRYGGEEFLIIFSDGVAHEQFAERIRAGIEALRFSNDEVRVTASIGIASATCRQFVNRDMLLRHADKAMYLAKQWGKNRIVVADQSGVPTRFENLFHIV